MAREKWLFRIHGCLIDATHHIGVTSRAYLEATAMSIAMGNARPAVLAAADHVVGTNDGTGIRDIADILLARIAQSAPPPGVTAPGGREPPRGL